MMLVLSQKNGNQQYSSALDPQVIHFITSFSSNILCLIISSFSATEETTNNTEYTWKDALRDTVTDGK